MRSPFDTPSDDGPPARSGEGVGRMALDLNSASAMEGSGRSSNSTAGAPVDTRGYPMVRVLMIPDVLVLLAGSANTGFISQVRR
jgi:hypothetical protein